MLFDTGGREMELDTVLRDSSNTEGARASSLGVVRPITGKWADAREGDEAALLKAIVVDPAERGRVIATNALMSFEPGFDVVTVADADGAEEWMENFVPDLLVVSVALGQYEANDVVARVLTSPVSRGCRVVSVGHRQEGEAVVVRGCHAALEEGVGLSQWLKTVERVFCEADLSNSKLG